MSSVNARMAAHQTSQSIKFETMTITPELASDWLVKVNALHRTNPRSVANYARAMEAGLWKLNGDPIVFSNRDKLLDGHARLKASVKSGKSFKSLVVFDVASDGFDTIDSVRKRTLGDILHIRREPNGRQLAAALMVIWRCRNGDLLSQKKQPSASDLLGLLDANPGIRDVSMKVAADAAPIMPLGLGTALHHLFSSVDPDKANDFFQQFIDGSEKSPPRILQSTLAEMAQKGGRRLQQMVIALSIKAWNAFYEEKTISFIRYIQDREKFPEIAGFDLNEQDHGSTTNADLFDSGAKLSPTKSDKHDLTVEICMVTPEVAQKLLEHNDGNRLVTDGVVAKYKRDIIAGKWMLNGQTIKVGKNGRLLDGQHRCRAGVQSGIEFPAIIVRGVDEDVFDTFDLGGRRSFSDILAQREEKNTAALSAALKWVWLHEGKKIFDRVTAPTNAELDKVLSTNPAIRESVKLANQLRTVIAPGMGVALHHLFSLKDAETAQEFIERLCDGQNLNKELPVWHLRERLLADRASRKIQISEGERWVLSIKTWNAVRQNVKIKSLSWRGKGPSREAIPEIL